MVQLIVGLGNPGAKYAGSRHNLGFEVVDALARRLNASLNQTKFHAEFGQVTLGQGKILLLKPQTFMNRSGISVAECATFFKIPPESILAIIDDLDLPAGALRLRKSGGSGGHNGMKSIIESLGSEAFPRLRLGIGRPSNPEGNDYLLSSVSAAERARLRELTEKASEAVEVILRDGIEKAMNQVNQREELCP